MSKTKLQGLNLNEQFLVDELWVLTVNGAFSRAYIYNNTNIDTNAFREDLKTYITDKLLPQYDSSVSEEKHISNIKEISDFSNKYSNILKNDKLNFGVSQKLLNLYLKYLWCFGKVNTPPHFPVDRIIQRELKVSPIVAWTKMEVETAYKDIIEKAKNSLEKYDCKTLADLELKLFKRR